MDNVKVFQSKAILAMLSPICLLPSRPKLLQPEANLQWRFQVILKIIAPGMQNHASDIDWSKWHVFFADERYVPLTHDDNFKSCQEVLFSKLSIPKAQIYPLDTSLALEDAAAAYASTLVSTAAKT